MPPGTPYNSFVRPYRIRVDNFAESQVEDKAALHLLTHTHSDHINGLSAQSFGYTVICSHDAKEMLLRHEVFAARELHELELRAEKTRTYSHLKVGPFLQPDGSIDRKGSRDLLVRSFVTEYPCASEFGPESSSAAHSDRRGAFRWRACNHYIA